MQSIYPIELQSIHDDNMIHFQVKNNQFYPTIQENDIVFIDRDDTKLEDGNVYLFSNKNKDMQIIRRIKYTLKDELKIITPTDSEIIEENILLDTYTCVGRIRKSISIKEEEL